MLGASTTAKSSFDSGAENGVGMALIGALAIAGGTVYSIVDAPYSAKRANAEQGLSLIPAPLQGPDKSTGWGAMLQATF